MEFSEVETYVRQILALEFSDRDHEIQVNTTRVKANMVARGLMNSTITLNNLSDFFLAEFKARIDLVAKCAVEKTKALKPAKGHDKAIDSVALFKAIASEQFSGIESAYNENAAPIAASLQSGIPTQIRQQLTHRMNSHMKKNELTIEFEYKAAGNAGPKEILALRPTFYGVGIDLKELWNRYMRRDDE